METEIKTKKNKKKITGIIILIASCVIIFVLFVTMLADLILVNLSISPVFSKIVSTPYNSGEYIEGHGILYSTIETKVEFGNGYIAGYKFYLGYKKYDAGIAADIPKKYHNTEDGTVTDIPKTDSGNSSSVKAPEDDGEDIINEDDVLNMDTVRMLADGGMTPFDFMEKFPGTVTDGDPAVYFVILPNDYVVRIEYSGDTVNYIRLEDHLINQYIDLLTQQIDIFLLEREQQQ